MTVNAIVIDDFYVNPDEVRSHALSQEFSVIGNYPGRRTPPFRNDSILNAIQLIIKNFAGTIKNWDISDYTGAFQYTTSKDRSWIHADQTTMWAGVCYLTQNAPLSAGTGLFKHKKTGLDFAPKNKDGTYDNVLLDEINKDSQDMTKWEMTERLANKYNRLVLYRGDFFHMSLDYFGQDKYDSRLFQTFFFDTEYNL